MASRKLIPFYILKVLRNKTDENHPMRAKEIQDHVNMMAQNTVIRKTETVSENIEMINQFFYRELGENDLIEETTGFSGRYKGNKHYYYSERVLSEDEVHFLHRMVMGQTSLDQKAAEEIKNKLATVLSEKQRERLKYRIVSDSSFCTTNRNIYMNLDVINKAVLNKLNIKYEYLEYNLKKELVPRKRQYDYVVSPYGVVVSRGKYYLFARHLATRQIRTYRIDRMQSVEILPETPYSKPKDFDIGRHGLQAINMHSSGEISNVELHCENAILSNVIEEFSQCKLKEDEKDSTRFFAVIPSVDLQGMRVWLRNYSHQVQVLKPEKLRKWLVKDLETALLLNQESGIQ